MPVRSSDGNAIACIASQASKLTALGKTRFDKALQVNLDVGCYGSFAEIGAGQEVSRTFLTAGAAAGTVGRSISAYDMQISDAAYGKSKRYVTQERCDQMMSTEYDILESCVRETRGPDVCFFAFASTLAARAFMSTRECEGWLGLTFQHAPGAKVSKIEVHIRITDSTAQEQGEAVGELGTNLVYLSRFSSDPYLITSYLLDGLAPGRLEVDFANFSGPAYPNVDTRLIAMKLLQFGVAKGVLMELDNETGQYKQAVPNSALYKTPLNILRSRFRPVTYAHKEIIEVSMRKMKTELDADARAPKQILNLQVDDISRPAKLNDTKGRLSRLAKFEAYDTSQDGQISLKELQEIGKDTLDVQEFTDLFNSIDVEGKGSIPIDTFTGVGGRSFLSKEFMARFRMLEPLKMPVLISSISQNYELASYVSRYTGEPVVLTVGGGSYSIERGLFKEEAYDDVEGGILEAFGKLFAKKVQIYEFPNVDCDGIVTSGTPPSGTEGTLYEYLSSIGKIKTISRKFLTGEVLDVDSNDKYRRGSGTVLKQLRANDPEWEKSVPPAVAAILKEDESENSGQTGADVAQAIFKFLEKL